MGHGYKLSVGAAAPHVALIPFGMTDLCLMRPEDFRLFDLSGRFSRLPAPGPLPFGVHTSRLEICPTRRLLSTVWKYNHSSILSPLNSRPI